MFIVVFTIYSDDYKPTNTRTNTPEIFTTRERADEYIKEYLLEYFLYEICCEEELDVNTIINHWKENREGSYIDRRIDYELYESKQDEKGEYIVNYIRTEEAVVDRD